MTVLLGLARSGRRVLGNQMIINVTAGGGREGYCNITKQIGKDHNCFMFNALLTL